MVYKRTRYLIVLLMILLFPDMTVAENIDSDNDGSQYAWSENTGWINLEPLGNGGPGVTVTDTTLKGMAWGENIGWINFNSAYGGIINDGTGNLSGYAWSENAGWINFAPAGGGVTISSSGVFSGYAWGENIGWINFAPAGTKIITLWRPTEVMPVPDGQQSWTYSLVALPITSSDPSQSKPIGVGSVATGGNTLGVQIGLHQCAGPVNIYGAYTVSTDPDHVHVLNQDGISFKAFTMSEIEMALSTGIPPVGANPWKANTTGPINQSLFTMPVLSLPKGSYTAYLLVTTVGSLNNYYLWSTSFVIP